jgi:hypothetical protein
MMNPRQRAQVALALCGTVGFAGWIVDSLAGPGSTRLEYAGAAVPTAAAAVVAGPIAAELIEDRRSPSLTAEVIDAPQATALGNIDIASADTATVAELVAGTDAGKMLVPDQPKSISDQPKPIVEAALPDPAQVRPPEAPLVLVATANTPDPVLDEPKQDPALAEPKNAVSTLEIREECLAAEICIDRFLWALYERTPKEDTIKVREQRKVTVKKKRKTVTVTRTFTRLVDQNFTWKDPKAAERVGMPMMDYVIGGMDRSFRLKLFHALHAAEQSGLSPGITSAFRDDYRQSIASGLKAAADRSFHGGSFRGGYGHGLAADVVSVKGATRAQRWVSTEKLWKWIDEHGKEFGIGRPYLGRDPPHVAPVDGKEYVSRRGGAKTQQAETSVKKPTRAARADTSAKRTNSAELRKANMRVATQVR